MPVNSPLKESHAEVQLSQSEAVRGDKDAVLAGEPLTALDSTQHSIKVLMLFFLSRILVAERVRKNKSD